MFGTNKYWLRELARREAIWANERRELLDRIMLLAGNPWTPPPVNDFTPNEPSPDEFGLEDETYLRETDLAY